MKKDIEKILVPRGMTNIGRALNVFNTTKYTNEVSMHNVIFMSDGQVTDGIHNKDLLKDKLQGKINKIMSAIKGE